MSTNSHHSKIKTQSSKKSKSQKTRKPSPSQLKKWRMTRLQIFISVFLAVSAIVIIYSLTGPCCVQQVTLSLHTETVAFTAQNMMSGSDDMSGSTGNDSQKIAGPLSAIQKHPALAPQRQDQIALAHNSSISPSFKNRQDNDVSQRIASIQSAESDYNIIEESDDGITFLEPYISPEAKRERQARNTKGYIQRETLNQGQKTRSAYYNSKKEKNSKTNSRKNVASYKTKQFYPPQQKHSLTKPSVVYKPLPTKELVKLAEGQIGRGKPIHYYDQTSKPGNLPSQKKSQTQIISSQTVMKPKHLPPAKPHFVRPSVEQPNAKQNTAPTVLASDPIKAAAAGPGLAYQHYQSSQRDIVIVRDKKGRFTNIMLADKTNRSIQSSEHCTSALAEARKRKTVPTMLIAICNATGVREVMLPKQQGLLVPQK